MLPLLGEQFGNPSSVHGYGRAARAALDEARERFARATQRRDARDHLHRRWHRGDQPRRQGRRVGGQGTRHVDWSRAASSITRCMHAMRHLEKFGFEVVTLPVDRYGRVDPDQLDAAINDRTILVSLLLANNEVGTVQPIDRAHPPRAHSPRSGDPPRRGPGRAVHGDRHARARRRHDLLRGTQVRGAEGHRRALPAPRHDPAAADCRAAPRSAIAARARRTWPAPWAWPSPSSWPARSAKTSRRASPLCATGCATRSWPCPTSS